LFSADYCLVRREGILPTLLKFAHNIDRLTEQIGRWLHWIVILTVGIGFYNVIARYVGRFLGLKLSSNTLIELQWYLFSLMFFLGFPYILKHGANVRVDFLYVNWSPRRKALVDFLGTVLFLIPFCLIGLFVTFNPVLQSWGQLPDGSWGDWEVSSDADGLPRAPIKSMILVCFALLLLQAISQAIKYWAAWRGDEPILQEIQSETEKPPLE
jgi:TRAP-type mannitol/chloroaromatic compound transport system permease small subunit